MRNAECSAIGGARTGCYCQSIVTRRPPERSSFSCVSSANCWHETPWDAISSHTDRLSRVRGALTDQSQESLPRRSVTMTYCRNLYWLLRIVVVCRRSKRIRAGWRRTSEGEEGEKENEKKKGKWKKKEKEKKKEREKEKDKKRKKGTGERRKSRRGWDKWPWPWPWLKHSSGQHVTWVPMPIAKFGLDRPSRSDGHRQPTDKQTMSRFIM